jgi:hypothetical protein
MQNNEMERKTKEDDPSQDPPLEEHSFEVLEAVLAVLKAREKGRGNHKPVASI